MGYLTRRHVLGYCGMIAVTTVFPASLDAQQKHDRSDNHSVRIPERGTHLTDFISQEAVVATEYAKTGATRTYLVLSSEGPKPVGTRFVRGTVRERSAVVIRHPTNGSTLHLGFKNLLPTLETRSPNGTQTPLPDWHGRATLHKFNDLPVFERWLARGVLIAAAGLAVWLGASIALPVLYFLATIAFYTLLAGLIIGGLAVSGMLGKKIADQLKEYFGWGEHSVRTSTGSHRTSGHALRELFQKILLRTAASRGIPA
ncbi:MAG: hypothetical protein U1A26_01430 [Candidatus Sungbacteria bacterium]|nr:hypothetical protein [Candidatus Sungbacteria bacterium]